MKKSTPYETIYTSPDNIVTIIRKKSGLKRYPNHSYPCVIFLLRPTKNTRVCTRPDGVVEYMASFDEIKHKLKAIDPKLAEKLPKLMRNKPEHVRKNWAASNAKRARNRNSKWARRS